ncbi:hypothetical protein [Sodalis sp. RH16]|uniref:hypothetical protein n=1 Tax=Sodalis sp. RH16 TaxID=3394331 RepID=UPI0039B66B63
MAKKNKHPEMRTPLFNCARIVLLRDREQAAKYIKKLTGEEFDFSGYDGFEMERAAKNRRTIMLGVFNDSAATLAHEAGHVAFEICSIVGIPTPNDHTNETFCYLVQRIMEKFLPMIKAKRGRWTTS